MSYSLFVCRKETREREEKSGDRDFFENGANPVPFDPEQLDRLRSRLDRCGYAEEGMTEYGRSFLHKKFGEALLTDGVLFFTAAEDPDSAGEICMLAFELTDTGEFAAYDPQTEEWEEA